MYLASVRRIIASNGWLTCANRDIVDIEPSDGDIWKMLLGSVDPSFQDRKDSKFPGIGNIITRSRRAVLESLPDMASPSFANALEPQLDEDVVVQLTAPPSSFNPDTVYVSGVEKASIFIDSGYEGSSIKQTPLARKEVNDYALYVQNTSSNRGLQEKNDSTDAGNGSFDANFDVRSVVSNDADIRSRVPSTFTYWERAAEENLGVLLASNTELKVLVKEAIERVGKDRFTVNLRRLLKDYYLDLRQLAVTNLEMSTVKLLQNRYSRIRLSQQIADIMHPETEQNDEYESQRVIKKRKELEDWIAQNPDFVAPTVVDAIDDDFSDAGSASEPDTSDGADQQPNVAQMETFLLTCGERAPFLQLSTNLRLFLLPPNLTHLARMLMSLPEKNVWINEEEDTSIVNRFKSFIEGVTEESWNWWPLKPQMRPLKKDHMRLHWLCVS